jgi:four helix bundle protein
MSAKIQRFEELAAWQKARALAADVYRATDAGLFSRDYGLRDQIRRAAVSVASNVAEGFERGSPSEFRQFLTIAKASCAELRTQLYVARDVGHLGKESFELLMARAEEVAKPVGGLRAAISRRVES